MLCRGRRARVAGVITFFVVLLTVLFNAGASRRLRVLALPAKDEDRQAC